MFYQFDVWKFILLSISDFVLNFLWGKLGRVLKKALCQYLMSFSSGPLMKLRATIIKTSEKEIQFVSSVAEPSNPIFPKGPTFSKLPPSRAGYTQIT